MMDASVPINDFIRKLPTAIPANNILLNTSDLKRSKNDDSDSEGGDVQADDDSDEDFGKSGKRRKSKKDEEEDDEEEVFVIPEREEGKRAIKGRATFSPDEYQAEKKKERKPRGQVIKKVYSKWENYRKDVSLQLRNIIRDTHMIKTYQTQTRDRTTVLLNDREMIALQDKVFAAKKQIKEIFNKIAAENKNDKVWHELAQEEDKEGIGESLNISHIKCSKCGGDDEEGNDILFCDCKGCYRAYHQNCLDPHVNPAIHVKDDEPWFCWQCETLDDCLDLINESRESDDLAEFPTWKDIYPEVDQVAQQQSAAADEDEDYEDQDKVVCTGIPDIGKSVAKVVRGIMVLGVIIEFKNAKEIVFTNKGAEDSDKSETTKFENCWWTVRWDDIKEENDETLIEYEAHEIIELLNLYVDYEKTNKLIDEKYIRHQQLKAIVAQEGIIDEGNIVDKKRSRKEVGYATLSMDMFGNLHDDDELKAKSKKRKSKPDDADESADENEDALAKKKQKPRPINPVTSHIKKEDAPDTVTSL